MIEQLYEKYWSFGRNGDKPYWWRTPEGKEQSDVFRQMVAMDKKDDVNRPKNGDRFQNGARL
jgi:hypothetical protein